MLTWMKAKLRDHFGFSKAETYGTLLLLLLMTASLLTSWGLTWYHSTQPEAGREQDIARLERTLALLEAKNQPQKPAKTPRKSGSKKERKRPLQPFDINTADAAQLSTLRGIGPVLSARIVKFRDKLGGFVRTAQYAEVYALPPEVVERLQKHTYLAKDFVPKRLNINTATVKVLAAHPYLSHVQARRIVRHRTLHGSFATVEALAALALLDNHTLKKVMPYLTANARPARPKAAYSDE